MYREIPKRSLKFLFRFGSREFSYFQKFSFSKIPDMVSNGEKIDFERPTLTSTFFENGICSADLFLVPNNDNRSFAEISVARPELRQVF